MTPTDKEAAAKDDRPDEFGSYLAEQMRNPDFANAYNDAGLRYDIRKRLIRLRHVKGLTQQEVASHMGVGQPTLSEFEGGESDPRLSTLQRYARAVGAELILSLAESTKASNE